MVIDTSDNTDAGFYAAGSDYRVEINSAKTVDSVSQSGVAIGTFSICNRAIKAGDAMALTSGERTTLAAVIWNALTSGMTTTGSIAKRLIDFLTGDVFARLGAPTGASTAADIATPSTW